MMKTLAILSNKGGVGKTSIAVNVAVYLAKQGNNVCLLDHDFQGPSLMTFFKPKVSWLNEYMTKEGSLDNYLQLVDRANYNLKGKLYVGFADPTHESIKSHLNIDKKRSMVMLQSLVKLKKELKSEPYSIDYFIMDCSPGISFLSINPILISDVSLFILKISNADLYGTTEMISGLYENLKNKSLILANHIPLKFINNPEKMATLENIIKQRLISRNNEGGMEFLGWIPADFELFNFEFEDAISDFTNESTSRKIFIHDFPEHIFSVTLINLIPRMFGD